MAGNLCLMPCIEQTSLSWMLETEGVARFPIAKLVKKSGIFNYSLKFMSFFYGI